MRLIGLLRVEEIAPQEIRHCMYSDHDVMPLSRMMHPESDYGLQLHQFRGKYSLVGQGKVENPGLGFNNAVIRLEKGKKEIELISSALKLIVERYTAFFELAAEDQQRCMHKLSGWVRTMMTLFLSGPHIFETLKWHQQREEDYRWSFLYDNAENESKADFENDSTRTWSAPYQPSAYSEEAILYLLSSMVQGLFKDYDGFRNTLQFSDKPRLEMSEILRSIDFPEATIHKLSESPDFNTFDLNTFLFRDLEEAKQFATQNPENPFFQLADIESESGRKALFAKWVSVHPVLNAIRKVAEVKDSPETEAFMKADAALRDAMLRVNELDIYQQKIIILIGMPLEDKLFLTRCLCHAGEVFFIRHLELIVQLNGSDYLTWIIDELQKPSRSPEFEGFNLTEGLKQEVMQIVKKGKDQEPIVAEKKQVEEAQELSEQRLFEQSLLKPAITSGRNANCFFQSFIHTLTYLPSEQRKEIESQYAQSVNQLVKSFNEKANVPGKTTNWSFDEIMQYSATLHPIDRECIFGPVLRDTYNALVKQDVIKTEPLGLGEKDIVYAHQTTAFSNCFGACLSVYTMSDAFEEAKEKMPSSTSQRIALTAIDVDGKTLYCDKAEKQPTLWEINLVYAGVHLNYTLGTPELNERERSQVIISRSYLGADYAAGKFTKNSQYNPGLLGSTQEKSRDPRESDVLPEDHSKSFG